MRFFSKLEKYSGFRVVGLLVGCGLTSHSAIFHSSAKPIQMKSSMTFIQSNGCTERYIIYILKNMAAVYMTTAQL